MRLKDRADALRARVLRNAPPAYSEPGAIARESAEILAHIAGVVDGAQSPEPLNELAARIAQLDGRVKLLQRLEGVVGGLVTRVTELEAALADHRGAPHPFLPGPPPGASDPTGEASDALPIEPPPAPAKKGKAQK